MSDYDQVYEHLHGVKRYGTYLMGLCPFHMDRRPSLKVTERSYHCYACGARGNLVKLLKAMRSQGANVIVTDTPPAHWNILPPFSDFISLLDLLDTAHDCLLDSKRLMWYPRKRGIEDMVIPCRIGWTDNWYTFPITNSTGDTVGAVARAGSQVKTDSKYIVPRGQPPLLYVPDVLLWRNAPAVYVTFGILDAITLVKLGFASATPTHGQYSLEASWFDDVRRPIYVVPDLDERSVAISLVSQLGWRGEIIELNYDKTRKDPNDYLSQGLGERLRSEILGGSK
jgi:DNA primase